MTLKLSQVIGHRGAAGYSPENTLVSMQMAQQLGVEWVEFDVMLTKDNEPIVIHDLTLERTTNGRGEVALYDLPAIRLLDGGSWFSEMFKGERVPSLQELLLYVSTLNLSINIEIKPKPGTEAITTQKTLAVLRKNWPASCPLPLISSFSREVLEEVYCSQTPCYLAYNIESWHENWQEVVTRYSCVSLHIDHAMLTPQKIREIKNKCEKVAAFTVNDIARAEELFQWGVDAVFSDYPDKILSSIRREITEDLTV